MPPLLKRFYFRILGTAGVEFLVRFKRRLDFCRSHGIRFFGMSRFVNIRGFLMDSEGLELYRIAQSLSAPAPVVVEIGSWVGKSTMVIGTALRGKAGATMYCIDPFDGSGGNERAINRYRQEIKDMKLSLRESFERNMRAGKISELVEAIPGYSTDVVKKWNREIDFLFIDGNHDLDAVRQDFIDWTPFVKRGGVIALHDVWLETPPNIPVFWTGPGDVVREMVLPDSAWQKISYVYSLFSARKSETGQTAAS